MNINSLPSPRGVDWKRIEAHLGDALVFYELPKATRGLPASLDLWDAQFVELGSVDTRADWESGPRMWMAYFSHTYAGATRILPIIVEFGRGNGFFGYVKTPPGRRGFNSTILFDQTGKLVSTVSFNERSTVRLVFLNKKLNDFGWEWRVAVALHIVDPNRDNN